MVQYVNTCQISNVWNISRSLRSLKVTCLTDKILSYDDFKILKICLALAVGLKSSSTTQSDISDMRNLHLFTPSPYWRGGGSPAVLTLSTALQGMSNFESELA